MYPGTPRLRYPHAPRTVRSTLTRTHTPLETCVPDTPLPCRCERPPPPPMRMRHRNAQFSHLLTLTHAPAPAGPRSQPQERSFPPTNEHASSLRVLTNPYLPPRPLTDTQDPRLGLPGPANFWGWGGRGRLLCGPRAVLDTSGPSAFFGPRLCPSSLPPCVEHTLPWTCKRNRSSSTWTFPSH